eukprot:CAMPEP_0179210204 /NCGR_PEP_ID=MMETSP0796-20121207/104839_1 /TAXON_ID=73915 /ORGANISM="Pyrodinium bahamense, Strain pbaha01" /LENGTH=337 /DNA_ID=CAMNT_0020915167 /DNA_START=42 /DNA_END=1052 /DNA_ORIENTATION=+
MKRFADHIGYFGMVRVATEAIFRIPNVPEPATLYADKMWAEVLPKDLKGKTYAITGSSRGMGFGLAKKIAERGGSLILLNRPSKHTDEARGELEKLAATDDLCDFDSVKDAAAKMRTHIEGGSAVLDVLVLNAGLMAQLDVKTKDGYDRQMQANHLSHFLLTSLVFDLLEKAASKHGEARIVSHSSGARNSPTELLRAGSFEKAWEEGSPCIGDDKPMAKWHRYQQSKRANLAFTYALADYIDQKGSKVKAMCVHPGATNSGLQAHTDAACWLDRFINGLAVVGGQSTDDGMAPLAMATLKEEASNGDFYGPVGLTGETVLLPSEREHEVGYPKEQL